MSIDLPEPLRSFSTKREEHIPETVEQVWVPAGKRAKSGSATRAGAEWERAEHASFNRAVGKRVANKSNPEAVWW